MMAGPPPPSPPRRRPRLLIILAVIVAVILVLGVVSFLFPPPPPGIQVTEFDIVSNDNVCGLDGATSSGFDANTSDLVPFQFDISGANASGGGTLGCTIASVTTSTPGSA